MEQEPLPAARPGGLPTISVVIPVLNERRVLARCLDALHAQTEPVDEIVVVDNGSSDGTAELAAGYPLVRVLQEPNRGISYARTTGFDAARGAVIARIDADTVVAPDWAAVLRRVFAAEPEASAVAGGAAIAELSPRGRFWCFWYLRVFRAWHQRSIGVRPMMYGFNGAIRREAWPLVRGELAMGDERVSEDVDLTISLLKTGHRIVLRHELRVKAKVFRSIDVSKLRRYYRTDEYTLARHGYGNPKRWTAAPEATEAADAR